MTNEEKKPIYNEKACGQCKEARRRRSQDSAAFWFCTTFRRSCEKTFDACNKYKELLKKVNEV